MTPRLCDVTALFLYGTPELNGPDIKAVSEWSPGHH